MGGERAKQKNAKNLKDDCPKCDKTTTGGISIGCDSCDSWWHPVCVNLTQKKINNISKITACKGHCPTLIRGVETKQSNLLDQKKKFLRRFKK